MKTQKNKAKSPHELGNSEGQKLDKTVAGVLVGSVYLEKTRVIKALVELGCPVLPVAEGEKRPSYLDAEGRKEVIKWEKYQDIQPTDSDFEKWFANPKNGIGIIPNGGLAVIDLDRKGFANQADCDKAYSTILAILPGETYSESTPSGGYHLIVRVEKPFEGRNFRIGVDGPHVGEILSGKSFAVLAPTKGYKALSELSVCIIPSFEALGLQRYSSQPGKKDVVASVAAQSTGPRISELISRKNQNILSGAEDFPADRSDAFTKLARDVYGWVNFLRSHNLSFAESQDSVLERAASTLGLDSAKVERIIETINPADCQPQLHRSRGDKGCLNYYREKLAALRAYGADSETDSDEKKPKAVRDIEFMRKVLGDTLRFNELKMKVELNGAPITHEKEYHLKFVEKFCRFIPLSTFEPSLYNIAKENAYNPVQDYLNDCHENFLSQEKVGVDVLENLASEYFNCNDEIAQIYVKKYLIGAVGRAFNDREKGHPNRKRQEEIYEISSKMDTVLMLIGGQGDIKSTFFRTLFGNGFFWDGLNDIGNKDKQLQTHAYWGIEWAELETIFSKRGNSQVKAYVTSEFDFLRAPYAKKADNLRRKFVLCGSTNESDFLTDSTGSRRYWPIRINGQTSLTKLSQQRDLIWGAAMQLFLGGEIWWLNPTEEKLREASNQNFRSQDEWESPILDKFGDREYVAKEDIYDFLEIPIAKVDQRLARRIRSILDPLGWESKNKRIDGQQQRVWVNPKFLQSDTDIGLVEVLNACTNLADLETAKKDFLENEYQNDSEGFQNRVGRYITLDFSPEKLTNVIPQSFITL